MFVVDGGWVVSASDLVAALECDHRVRLDLARRAGLLQVEPVADPLAALAGRHGEEHEARVLEQVRARFGDVVEVAPPDTRDVASLRAAADATVRAMRSGVPVVFQGVFFDGGFYGRADFLIRTDLLADNPDGGAAPDGYEVADAKLSRSVKPSALLQLAAYSQQVAAAGFAMPQRMHVWLGDGTLSSHDVDDVLPVLDQVRGQVDAVIAAGPRVPSPVWGAPRAACGHCGWAQWCDDGRVAARDLSLVAGMRADQARRLSDAGVGDLDALAAASDGQRPADMAVAVFDRLRAQARLQVAQDATRSHDDPVGRVSFEVFSTEGLRLLPPASPGDVWFDMEGDPFAQEGDGLEYLFGAVTADTGTAVFTPWWAHTRAQERAAFEAFVDFVEDRRARWPGLHVYHYAPYERTAMRRLAGEHGTREDVIDDWLRSGVLVDLYAVVRGSVRVSQRSYSIKKLEPLYGVVRSEDVQTAGDSIVDYQAYLDLLDAGDPDAAAAKLTGIRDYNQVDCESTLQLDRWLREQARDALGVAPEEAAGPSPVSPDGAGAGHDTDNGADDDGAGDVDGDLVAALTDGLPDRDGRDAVQQARAMLAAAVGYHRREDRPQWWEHFHRLDLPREELQHVADVLLVDRVDAEPWTGKRTRSYRDLTIEPEPDEVAEFDPGDPVFLGYDPPAPSGMPTGADGGRGYSEAAVTGHRDGVLTVTETTKTAHEYPDTPVTVMPGPPVRTTALARAVRDQAAAAVHSLPGWPDGPAFDLLARRPPRVTGPGLPRTGDDTVDVLAAVRALDHSYLAVQGPPGTGKTRLGAHVVTALVNAGWRVGVVAQSHKVVENLLDEALRAGLDPARVGKEPKGASTAAWARPKIGDWLAATPGGVLVGGTAWTFCRRQIRDQPPLDLLVVDEAGQFSLANVIAVSGAARNLLLLGDPQQLPQVSQGRHPEPVDTAALAWLTHGHQVLPAQYGYFLATTWRMHPALTAPVSRLAYRRALHAHPDTTKRHLHGVDPGIHAVPIDHTDRSVHSPEEAAHATALVGDLIGRDWHDGQDTRTLTERDVLIVAPYNRQVDALARALRDAGHPDVRVGTVDKFQGQQAPVVLVSMTASSHDDIPRGLDFLLSRNRLNVAVSRAQWATYLLHSPRLVHAPTSSVGDLTRLGGFLGLLTPDP